MIRVIRPNAPGGALPLLLVDVALLGACFYAAAEYLYPPSAYYYLFLEGGVTLTAIAIATIVFAMYFFDLYADLRSGSRIVLLQQLCQALGVAIIAQTVAIYLFRDWTVPHLMMIYSCLLALAVLFIWRLAFGRLIESVAVHGKLLFLGRSSTSEAVAQAIEADPKTGYRVVGFVEDSAVNSLRTMVEEHKPNLLVVGLSERRDVMPVADLVALRFSGLQIEEASKTFESFYQRVCLPDLSEQEVMFARAFVPSAGALNVTRVLSFVMAVFCLIVFSPVLLLLAIWLKLRSREPMLIKLERESQNGRKFFMLRFRRHPSLERLFDRYHVDALPELINVLRGDMSLVGPRPETPECVQALVESLPFYNYRTLVPPGVTGWSQIHTNEHNRDNQELALEYDLYYIKNISLALDLYILAHSLKNRVLRG